MTEGPMKDADYRAIAHAYIEQREAGSLDYAAFLAAVAAYRARHPDTPNGEAAHIVSRLMQDIPRAACY